MLFAIQVQHTSAKQRDGIWHTIEVASCPDYAEERREVFAESYLRPVRIVERS